MGSLPGDGLNVEKVQAIWLLARLGKRVLRSGGLGMTQALLADLNIGTSDNMVEFEPGLGVTAHSLLEKRKIRGGVERNAKAVQWTALICYLGSALSLSQR